LLNGSTKQEVFISPFNSDEGKIQREHCLTVPQADRSIEFLDENAYLYNEGPKGMRFKKNLAILSCFLIFLIAGCATTQQKIPIDTASVQPGTQVAFKGKPVHLLGSPIGVGKPLPPVELVDAMSMSDVDLSKERGSVLLLSIVPSLDTPVCEAQTHYLEEAGKELPKSIKRIVISRDTPFAQKRFAKEAKLTNLEYLSDYKQGDFARSTGLLAEGLMLFARSVIVVDQQGIVRYLQVVPEMSHLPDLEKAFAEARKLAGKG
jgi:thiol peroxidase